MVSADVALGVIGTGGAIGGSLAGLAAYARRRYGLTRSPDEQLTVKTMDSWPLGMLHYRPSPKVVAYAEPVILCHGLAANSFNLDLNERYSVARFLAARGFHTFVPDLRGRAGSWPDKPGRRARHDYTFDDHVGLDAPAILDAALANTGARRAFWIGHSMGGMLGYVLAGREPERVAGLVTLAAPARLRFDRLLGRIIEMALTIPLDPIPQRFFAQALAPIITRRFPPFVDISVLRWNMEQEILRRALTNVVVDLPRTLIRQFANWAWKEQPISSHGGVNYLDAIARVRAPLLALAGTGDRIATVEDVRFGVELVKSPDKTFISLGSGGREDPMGGRPFGHVDMVLGRDAPDRVFPVLGDWLEQRANRVARQRLAG